MDAIQRDALLGIKQQKEDDQPSGIRFFLLWVFSSTLILVACWLLIDSIMNGSAIGTIVSGTWLINIVLTSLYIHALLSRT